MRILLAGLLSGALLAPASPGFAAPPDEGVSAAAAASTPEDAAAQGDQAAAAIEPQDLEARLTAVQGPVYVHLVDHQDGEYAEAEADMPIAAGDEIRVGDGGSAELVLDGQTVIQLGPSSDFVVNSLAPAATEFHLGVGSLVAKIKHLVEGRGMEFHTPTAIAAVRGTELGVAQGEDGEPARIGVFDEGRVAVRGQGNEGEVHLGPNQEAQVAHGQPIAAPSALSFWTAHRARIERARARQRQFLASWRPRTVMQRLQRRRAVLQRRKLRLAELKGLSPQQRARTYKALRRRQAALRQRVRGLKKVDRKRRAQTQPDSPDGQQQGESEPRERPQRDRQDRLQRREQRRMRRGRGASLPRRERFARRP